jgi:tetratricopeptide (TPR) repeat protein
MLIFKSLRLYSILMCLGFSCLVSFAQQSVPDSLNSILRKSKIEEQPALLLELAYHYLSEDPDKVLDIAIQTKELSIELEQYSIAAEACKIQGILWQNQAAYDSAIISYKKGLEYARQADDLNKVAHLTGLIGYVLIASEAYDEAMKYYVESLRISRENNNQEEIGRCLNNIGTIHQNKREYDSSLHYYNLALALFNKINYDKGKAETYNNIGVIDFYRGDYTKAIAQFINALEIKQKLGEKKGIGIYLGNIAGIYQMMGNYPKAIEFFEKSLQIHEELQNMVPSAIMLGNIGNVYQEWGEPEKSLKYFEQSLQKYTEAGHTRGTAITQSNIGNVYFSMKQYEKAIVYQEMAIKIFKEINDEQELANALLKRAESLAETKQTNKAKQDVMQCITLAEKMGLKAILKAAYFQLATIYENERVFDKANHYYKLFMHINDSILNEEKHRQIAELQEKYDASEKNRIIKSLNNEKKIQELKITKQRNESIIIVISSLGLIFITGLFFYIYRFRQKHKENLLSKQMLEIEKKLLLVQMNPHFIFNSLNSIHGFISIQQSDKAKEYLARFGSLMRLILESSRKSLILLEDEIKILDLYLKLEKARFDDNFDYKIEAPNIKTDEMWIPPMLVQPFAENAVQHGMSKLQSGNGFISICFDDRSGYLLCTLEDNGPGIEQTKTGKNDTHKSLGIELTNERLELLAKQWNKELAINIISPINEQEAQKGTRIEIEIPFEID